MSKGGVAAPTPPHPSSPSTRLQDSWEFTQEALFPLAAFRPVSGTAHPHPHHKTHPPSLTTLQTQRALGGTDYHHHVTPTCPPILTCCIHIRFASYSSLGLCSKIEGTWLTFLSHSIFFFFFTKTHNFIRMHTNTHQASKGILVTHM